MSLTKEFALGMGQSANNAVTKDAQVGLSEEECALDMGQRLNDVAMKDAQTVL